MLLTSLPLLISGAQDKTSHPTQPGALIFLFFFFGQMQPRSL